MKKFLVIGLGLAGLLAVVVFGLQRAAKRLYDATRVPSPAEVSQVEVLLNADGQWKWSEKRFVVHPDYHQAIIDTLVGEEFEYGGMKYVVGGIMHISTIDGRVICIDYFHSSGHKGVFALKSVEPDGPQVFFRGFDAMHLFQVIEDARAHSP